MDRILIILFSVFGMLFLFNYINLHGFKNTFRYILTWVLAIVLSAAMYSNKSDLVNNEVIASIFPSKGYHKDGKAVYYRSEDGHFYIDAVVGNSSIRFIVDTGASGVAITPSDAKKLGISLKRLQFTEIYETAAGTTRAAPIIIHKMQIGDFLLKDIKASVNEADGSVSLMGMSVLRQFTISISEDKLVLSR